MFCDGIAEAIQMEVVLRFWQRLLSTVFVLFAVSTSVSAEGLAGSEWRPSQIGSSAVTQYTEQFIQFKGGGKLAGHGGCNRIFGQYKISGNEIEMGPVGATRMACAKPVMDLEIVFFTVLETAKTFRRDKASLVLFGADGREQVRLAQTDRD
ncbi:MAG: META domain-containing protein [Gammaproteobacteria bacterium]